MTDNSADRNKQGCVHPHQENVPFGRGALGGTVGTRMKTEAMVSSAHSHGPSGVVSLNRAFCIPRAAGGNIWALRPGNVPE